MRFVFVSQRKHHALVKAAMSPKKDAQYELLELFHFGFRGIVGDVDAFLGKLGLNRSHHRILYFIARAGHIPLGNLIEILGVSRQAVHRPLKQLAEADYVKMEPLESNRRVMVLSLTRSGADLERKITGMQVDYFRDVEAETGAEAIEGWKDVMRQFSGRTAYEDLDSLLGRSRSKRDP